LAYFVPLLYLFSTKLAEKGGLRTSDTTVNSLTQRHTIRHTYFGERYKQLETQFMSKISQKNRFNNIITKK